METVISNRVATELARHYTAIREHVPLLPIRNDQDYEAAVSTLNALMDAGGADEQHALADLTATLGELIGDYEALRDAAPPVAPADILRHLMEAHGLRQGDLPEIGSQGVVSEVLRGVRELNLRQIRALAERFGMSAAVFVDAPRH
jgi:HTH-type transcriptional regulator/antitoxin HigA